MEFIKLNFPKAEVKNVRLFYIINAGLSFWLVEAIWYFYWSRFANFSVIGIIFASLTLIWILLEIPTGAIADMFGRKKATVIGCASLFIGSIVLAGAQSYWYLIIGGLIQNVGRAFISGSLEALVYDTLKKNKEERWFDDVMAAKTRISIISYSISTLLGGFLYILYFRLAHIVTSFAHLLITYYSLKLKEIEVEKKPKQSLRNYLIQNLEGFRQLSVVSLRPYLFSILTIMVLFYLYDWGFSKPAMAVSFGYGPRGQAVIYTLMALVNTWLLGKLPLFRKRLGDFKGIISLNLLIGVGYMLSVLNWGYIGILILLLIEISGALSEPWISTIVNRSINSQDRATTLSSLEFVSKIPFIFLIIISGNGIENQTLKQLHLMLGIIILFITLISIFINKKKALRYE